MREPSWPRSSFQVVFSNPVAGKGGRVQRVVRQGAHPGTAYGARHAVGHPLRALHEAAIYHVEGGAVPEHKYMCVYEMEGDVDEIMTKIRRSVAGGQVHMSDSLDLPSSRLSFWLPGETVTA